MVSPRPVTSRSVQHSGDPWQARPSEPLQNKCILLGVPAPADPEPVARRAVRRPDPKMRSGKALPRPPGKTSPTFSGQEGGRPRAFPVVQLRRTETSLHSHSLGCQRTGGQSSAPSRAGRARRGRGLGGRGSRVLDGRPAPSGRRAPRGDAAEPPGAASAAGAAALPPRINQGQQLLQAGLPLPHLFPRVKGKVCVSRCLEEALSLGKFLSLIFNIISPKTILSHQDFFF